MRHGPIEKTMSLRCRLESRQMNLGKAPWMALIAAPSYPLTEGSIPHEVPT